jgi:hypothetical protein
MVAVDYHVSTGDEPAGISQLISLARLQTAVSTVHLLLADWEKGTRWLIPSYIHGIFMIYLSYCLRPILITRY